MSRRGAAPARAGAAIAGCIPAAARVPFDPTGAGRAAAPGLPDG